MYFIDLFLHVDTRSEGLIDGCDLVFLAKSKDGEYHQEMNSFVFLDWFENQLMPALKNPRLVVLDNAGYHNVKTEDTVFPNVTGSQKKNCSPKLAYTSQHSFFCYWYQKVFHEKIEQKNKTKTPVVYKTDNIVIYADMK